MSSWDTDVDHVTFLTCTRRLEPTSVETLRVEAPFLIFLRHLNDVERSSVLAVIYLTIPRCSVRVTEFMAFVKFNQQAYWKLLVARKERTPIEIKKERRGVGRKCRIPTDAPQSGMVKTNYILNFYST